MSDDPGAYAIVFSDMRMPVVTGVDFLRQARLIARDSVRILLTGQADLNAVIKVVNDAGLFRYLTKPCDAAELMGACVAALHHQRMQIAERVVLDQTLRGSVETLAEVLALSNPAAFGRAQRITALARALAAELELARAWEVEVAAMLADIGAVTRGLLRRRPRLEVLRFVSDYDALETHGGSRAVALSALHSRGCHDVRVLAAAARVIGVAASAFPVRDLPLAGLASGMTLADDVWIADGRLLVARGQRVNDQLVSRLANVDAERIRQPILVFESPATA